MIGLPNPDQRSVAQTSGFPHPYIYTYTARALLLERILALRGEGITWMGQPSRQGIVLFSVRTEFWRSTTRGEIRELGFLPRRGSAGKTLASPGTQLWKPAACS